MITEQLRGESGQKFGHAAVDRIGKFKLSATPQNYEVWLHYITGWTPDLVKTMNAAIDKGEKLTDVRMEELHEKFFSSTQLSTQVVETGNRIAKEIADAIDALKSATDTTEQYGATLQTASHTLSNKALSGDALQRVVSVLATATNEMSSQNGELHARLKQSSREIESLRASLQAARAEALTDGLTGVANRKLFDETLRNRVLEAETEGYELCLILCDIDHFKSFNDRWGHQTGDQVIRFVAGSLSAYALPDHLVARYGGEEFAIIMPRTSLKAAIQIAESIRAAIEAKKLMRRSTNEPLGQITVSFGVADYQPGESPAQLIERSDAFLYESKRTGRNRVTSSSTTSSNAA